MDKENIVALIEFHSKILKVLRAELKRMEQIEQAERDMQSPNFTPLEPAYLGKKPGAYEGSFSFGDEYK